MALIGPPGREPDAGRADRPLAGDKRDRILNKQRLMLSAAMAALVAGATLGARADTEVIANQPSGALTTSPAGNITIDQGGEVLLKSAATAITINSNNFLSNSGAIDNLG